MDSATEAVQLSHLKFAGFQPILEEHPDKSVRFLLVLYQYLDLSLCFHLVKHRTI